VSRLKRAAALAVKPSDVGRQWAALSVTLTDAANQFAPQVSVACYPKASAPAPGCCYTDIGTILLDGDLVSDPDSLGAEKLSSDQCRELATLTGVLLHECGHAVHSDPQVLEEASEAGVLEETKILEEARMETRLCDRAPVARRFIQAAVRQINAPHLPDAGAAISRGQAAHVAAILGGRVHAGTLPAELRAQVDEVALAGLGEEDGEAIAELVEEVTAIADSEAEAMIDASRRYREIVGEPEAPSAESLVEALKGLRDALEESEATGQGEIVEAEGGSGEPGGAGGAEDGDGEPGSGKPVDEDLEAARELLAEVVGELEREVEAAEGRENARQLLAGRGAGAADGSAPGVDPGQTPGPSERRAARELERRLRRARSRRTAREGAKMPGHFHAVGAVRQAAERSLGIPAKADPFTRAETIRGSLWAPEVAVVVDNSGSMACYFAELGRVIWVAHESIGRLGGRVATSTFGSGAALAYRCGRPLRRVPDVNCGGGTGFLGEAIKLAEGELRLSDHRRPRLMFLVSDGDLYGTEDGKPEIERLKKGGVGVIHVGIGRPSGELGASRTVVIPDAARLAGTVGDAAVDALNRGAGTA
jgi:hypothetical protein